jgi:hypothetical protein
MFDSRARNNKPLGITTSDNVANHGIRLVCEGYSAT